MSEMYVFAAVAGGSFLRPGQWTLEEFPTSAAELEIQVMAIQAGDAVEDTEPPGVADRAA
jgi:hypothetical protein